MRSRQLAAIALLASAALLPGCSILGGPYEPSARASRIAAMDIEGGLDAPVDIPGPLPDPEIAALPKGSLAYYVARTIAESPIVIQGYAGIASGIASADQAAAVRGLSLGIDSHFGGTDSGGAEKMRTDRESGAFGAMTLFDGGAGRLREQRARWTVVSTAASAEDRVESVAYAVVDAYISVLRGRAGIKLANAEIAQFDHLLAQVRVMSSAGGASIADVPEAEARFERIRQQAIQARQALGDSEAKFRRLVGEAPDMPTMVQPPTVDLPKNAGSAQDHPQVRAYDAQIRAAIKNALSVDAERFGSVVTQFGPAGFAQAFGGGSVTTLGTAFIHLTLPVFDSGERASRLRKAASDLQVAIAQREDTFRSVQMSMTQANNALVAAIDQAALVDRERRASQRLARAKGADYKAALVDLRSVLDAEEATANANLKAEGAVWDRILASYRLLGASGTLAQTLKAVTHMKVDLKDPETPLLRPSLIVEPEPEKCSFDGDEAACSFKTALQKQQKF